VFNNNINILLFKECHKLKKIFFAETDNIASAQLDLQNTLTTYMAFQILALNTNSKTQRGRKRKKRQSK
jgi:hypothetical protein